MSKVVMNEEQKDRYIKELEKLIEFLNAENTNLKVSTMHLLDDIMKIAEKYSYVFENNGTPEERYQKLESENDAIAMMKIVIYDIF